MRSVTCGTNHVEDDNNDSDTNETNAHLFAAKCDSASFARSALLDGVNCGHVALNQPHACRAVQSDAHPWLSPATRIDLVDEDTKAEARVGPRAGCAVHITADGHTRGAPARRDGDDAVCRTCAEDGSTELCADAEVSGSGYAAWPTDGVDDALVDDFDALPLAPCEAAVVALKQEDYIPYDYDAALNEIDCGDAEEFDTVSERWAYLQERQNTAYHVNKRHMWCQQMLQETILSVEQCTCGVKALLAEASRRDLRRLEQTPTSAFEGAKLYAQQPLSLASLKLLLVQATTTKTTASAAAACKRAYVEQARQQWRVLRRQVEERLATAAPGTVHCVTSLLSTLTLFNDNPFHVVRELNLDLVDEQRRQRRLRAERLLQSLAEQGRLFVLPTLYAEEVVPPTPNVARCASHVTDLAPQLTDVLYSCSQTLSDDDMDEDVSGASAGETVSSANSSKSTRSSLSMYLDSPSSHPCSELVLEQASDVRVTCAGESQWLATLATTAGTRHAAAPGADGHVLAFDSLFPDVTRSVQARQTAMLSFLIDGKDTEDGEAFADDVWPLNAQLILSNKA